MVICIALIFVKVDVSDPVPLESGDIDSEGSNTTGFGADEVDTDGIETDGIETDGIETDGTDTDGSDSVEAVPILSLSTGFTLSYIGKGD
ncbi:MAG TPA: hypothetical protein VET47_00125 [Candidatus Limnocylindrales bacterium]|nr:hypothetical protein [Candidatus Limnocylindrales bacterium]